jgi:hypothetical protein
MAIINLTPHSLHIYPPDTPDRIAPHSVPALHVVAPSPDHQPARLGHQVLGEDLIDERIPVERVAFGPQAGQVSPLPEPRVGTWYVVAAPPLRATPTRRNQPGRRNPPAYT